MQIEAFDWASASITRTADPCAASASANATTVAVFPTPPFMVATARSLPVTLLCPRQWVAGALPRGAAAVYPVLDANPRQTPELARVVGDDDQALRARVSADQHVERPHRLAETLDVRTNLAKMRRGFLRECKDLKPRCELLDRLEIFKTPSGFFRPVMQLRKRDARHAKLLGETIEAFAQLRRGVLDHIDADVAIERILQDQSGPRSPAAGSSRPRTNTPDAPGALANREAQRL